MMKCILFFITFFSFSFAQEKEFNSAVVKVNKYIEGTLVTPYADSDKEVPLVILIMDAGAINRDGNDRMSRNDTFKQFSFEIAKLGVSTYRYDKRLFKMDGLGIREHEISFDHYIEDVKSVIDYFKKNGNYTKIFVAAATAFKQLKEQGRATTYDPALESIFRYDLQSFMKSWLKYSPIEEISKLEIPILIIHGDRDIQVELSQAEKLKEAVSQAEYLMIQNMNHILKEIKGNSNRLENQKSYNEPWRKIMPEVLNGIANFVNQQH